MYIELVDMGFKSIRNFYYDKLPIFNKYASSVSDTIIDQYELDKRAAVLENSRARKLLLYPIKFHDERFFEYPEEKHIKGQHIRPVRFVGKDE